MKFTLDWLNEYTDISNLEPTDIADQLTMLGLEVDSVDPLYQELKDLKTAKVLETAKHPNADKLTLCKVAVGDQEYKIVCGAPNVRAGLCTVVALPGVVLPGNFKIKKSKVRGEESQGMLCSEKELGLGDSHDGIMELPENTPHGEVFIDAVKLADILIDIDLTPNRPDCASVIGIAREVAGYTKRSFTKPVFNSEIAVISQKFSVDVESPELCPRYAARLIENVKIAPSPWWLRKRLLAVGLRPINNVVDITNYVMMEYGQPLHAFDFDTLGGKKIIVRCPKDGESKFTTLDNTERQLERDTLLICDADKPIALAGVMGGLNSEVNEGTVNVLLESACFNAVSIRKTARRMKLATDASYRFERGVDPGGTCDAMNRAVELLCSIAGGTAEEEGADIYLGIRPFNSQTIRVGRTSTILGLSLDKETIRNHLESIGFTCEDKDEDTLWVKVPTFRIDVEREADLVEEVARLVGYNNIPVNMPTVSLSFPENNQERLKRNNTADYLTSIGYSEAINYSFVSETCCDQLCLKEDDSRRKVVRLLNPLTEEQSVMRTMLLPGLLENVKHNNNFQQQNIKLFEMGMTFSPTEEDKLPVETMTIAGVITGNRHGQNMPLYFDKTKVDIFDIKGGVEGLLKNMRLNGFEDDAISFYQPVEELIEPFAKTGLYLEIHSKDEIIGSLGKVNNKTCSNFAIKQDIYYFELDYSKLCELNSENKKFSELPVYPAVKRDTALVVSATVSGGEVLEAVGQYRDKLIDNYELFDIYQGKSIKEGFKSVAITVTYRSDTKTLTDKNVDKSHNKLVKMLSEKFGGSYRE